MKIVVNYRQEVVGQDWQGKEYKTQKFYDFKYPDCDFTVNKNGLCKILAKDGTVVSVHRGYESVVREDLPIEKPKKTVVKEAEKFGVSSNWYDPHKNDTVAFIFPKNAKNIKCTYEVEE